MRYARNVGLAFIGLLVLVFGVRALVRRPGPSSATSAPHTTISIAKFSEGGSLDNCADVTFGASKKEIDAEKLKARGFKLLQSTCAKTFPNSVAFASCTHSDLEGDAQPSTQGVGYYYDVATLLGDETYSGQCLGNGGTWVLKPKDDPQFASARARLAGSKPHHEFDSLMELLP